MNEPELFSVEERFENKNKRWFADLRNGMSQTTGIELWGVVGDYVWIDFISSRNKTLRGGARVPVSAMRRLCIKFLEATKEEGE